MIFKIRSTVPIPLRMLCKINTSFKHHTDRSKNLPLDKDQNKFSPRYLDNFCLFALQRYNQETVSWWCPIFNKGNHFCFPGVGRDWVDNSNFFQVTINWFWMIKKNRLKTKWILFYCFEIFFAFIINCSWTNTNYLILKKVIDLQSGEEVSRLL